jgi:putative flippase GtrA
MRQTKQFLRWGCKSALALALNLAILTLWVEVAGIPAEIAVLINWVMITIPMYVVTDRWVFSDEPSPGTLRGHVGRYVELEMVKGASKVGNYVIFVVVLRLGVVYQAAWAIGAVVMFLATFVGGRWLWTNRSSQL